jgi:hypothetical protein
VNEYEILKQNPGSKDICPYNKNAQRYTAPRTLRILHEFFDCFKYMACPNLKKTEVKFNLFLCQHVSAYFATIQLQGFNP